ncbi:tripartite tricarboxylate transporter permease [Tautonia plasticadhaerens]|uniref:Tripartite tricarboxylate transporter TctA family protein n=1 Tax=Tautonia plasticadhaerens TaxID=2527974 RepID=A0A518H8B4_9BACT|nr:tripartite tricarboxylate transporter permease [Tautonia plasticadhaerens]QDV37107.1 Tripartite tricarboxylate transporter TctA family protein [Tautonia plasticadhaerens]
MDPAILEAFRQVLLDPMIWAAVLGAAVYGVFVGAVPGLTATMAMALLVPVTYWMPPLPALAAVVTMVACAIFSGDIPTILLRIPGTPASAAYADIGSGLSSRGKGDEALVTALVFSVAGGLFGAVVLIVLGSQLAQVGTLFSPAEHFWLYVLGLTCAVVVSKDAPLKGALAVLLGLLVSTVGLSAVHASARFTLGYPELYQGIGFIPAMIGLFGVSEVLKNLLTLEPGVPGPTSVADVSRVRVLHALPGSLRRLFRRPVSAFRSGSIGALIGMLPGAGADIASWVSLGVSSRSKPEPDTPDDEAALDRLSDATTANSSALAGAWIPALIFGIPGDSVTAIVIGVLMMKDLRPGPEIFEKQPIIVYGLYLIFILANLALLPIGLLAIKAGGLVLRAPRRILMPVILLFCVLGSYAINGSTFDIGVMLASGLAGFALERRGVPLGPVVLGIILGGPLEERLIQVLTSADGSAIAFIDRWPARILALIWLILLFVSLGRGRGPDAIPASAASREDSSDHSDGG